MTGRTIGHYHVLEKLGEGGMGVVYKARDTHLDRFVALKILPADKVANPERKRRFVQEAKAASALNHPNIVTIHDIDESGGVHFIAMEFVAGKTLDRLIGRKGMKLSDALNHSVQITEALAKAHAAGIVHRDLKPSNIMLTPDGLIKILDFGLAKLTEAVLPTGEEATETLTQRPHTEEGVIVGTVAYMSPEQAEARPVDARSDIFSFGSVLFEMLTGQKAFQGESKVSTLSAILHKEPKAASEISDTVPPEADRILNRCLRKDPQRRWQTMADLRIALQDLKEESESGAGAALPARRKPRPNWRWLAAGAALVAIAAASVFLWQVRRPPPALDLKTERFTADPGSTLMPSITPDGRLAAYASDRSGEGNFDIWVQHLSGGQPSRLTRHEADDYSPSISPDGSRIAFRSERDGGGIYIAETLTGTERKLVAGGISPSFSPDGSTIAYVDESRSTFPGGRVYTIPSQGGQPKEVSPGWRVWAIGAVPLLLWSDDGRYLLSVGMRTDGPLVEDWWVAPAAGGPPVSLDYSKTIPKTVPVIVPVAWHRGYLYYARGSLVEGAHLFRVPLQSGAERISGSPQRLTSGAGCHLQAAFSDEGRMLFSVSTYGQDLVSLALNPATHSATGPPVRITTDASVKGGASVSRDGKLLAYVAFVSWETGKVEIRLQNLATGAESVYLAGNLPVVTHPVISPDGSTIGYSSIEGGKLVAFAGPVDNPPGRRICEDCQILGFFTTTRQALIRYGANRLVRQDLATGTTKELLTTGPAVLAYARLSPDDRWILLSLTAVDSDMQMWILPVRDPAPPQQAWIRLGDTAFQQWQMFRVAANYLANIRPNGPAWSTDGNFLYFPDERDGHICLWGLALDPSTKQPRGTPFIVHHQHRPVASRAAFGRSQFVITAPGKLILPVLSSTCNLWMAKLDER